MPDRRSFFVYRVLVKKARYIEDFIHSFIHHEDVFLQQRLILYRSHTRKYNITLRIKTE